MGLSLDTISLPEQKLQFSSMSEWVLGKGGERVRRGYPAHVFSGLDAPCIGAADDSAHAQGRARSLLSRRISALTGEGPTVPAPCMVKGRRGDRRPMGIFLFAVHGACGPTYFDYLHLVP